MPGREEHVNLRHTRLVGGRSNVRLRFEGNVPFHFLNASIFFRIDRLSVAVFANDSAYVLLRAAMGEYSIGRS